MTDPATPMQVMLATDGSDAARTAETWITRLAFATSPIVDVLCVAGRSLTRLGWGVQSYREPVRRAVEGLRQGELLAAERIANEVGERLQGAGFTVRIWARQGECCEELLSMTDAERPDLVVVGPRGRSGLAAAVLGSVTHSLVAQATVPVLVARPPATAEGRLPNHAMVLVDGTERATSTIAWLRRAGWLTDGRATMLGLLGDRVGLEQDEPALVDEVAGLVRSDATQMLDRLALPLAEANASLEFDLREGHPLQATLDAVEASDVDLIAVARPLPRPGRDPLAEKIARHAPASVLLVPSS